MPAIANRVAASVAVAGPCPAGNTRAPATGRPSRSLISPVNYRNGSSRIGEIVARSPPKVTQSERKGTYPSCLMDIR
jgi:hypothetical protein